jgi:hypothetical protein
MAKTLLEVISPMGLDKLMFVREVQMVRTDLMEAPEMT